LAVELIEIEDDEGAVRVLLLLTRFDLIENPGRSIVACSMAGDFLSKGGIESVSFNNPGGEHLSSLERGMLGGVFADGCR